ncbi:MAG: FtsK/SpoIIIE domain-containing protein [Actinobacteria bacterium]|nr:FtsK/SpoIIIE domain-containing protein [Actinomycetota bacterium]
MTYVPRLRRMRWTGLRLEIDLGLVMGQTVDDVAVASDRLGHAVDAERVQVQAVGRSARVIFSFANLLGTPFDARVPAVNESADPRRIYMGIAEDGSPWTVSLGASTLVAGSSGAGKASLIWGLMFGLGPSIKAQTVTVYGIDLKGGMELTMGEALFTRFATRPADAVELLEQAAAEMSERALRLGGHTRQHYPSVADPLVVVLIDELAAITAYLNDRPLRLRAEAAISLLCSQGRAVGYTVFACLQDPRKEVVPNRGLFTQMIALRLKDTSETVMVLGEGALAAGARCHQIPRSQPGVGFAIPEEGGSPVRVRAGFVSDDAIRLAAARFPAHRVITLPQEDYTSTVETETKSAK